MPHSQKKINPSISTLSVLFIIFQYSPTVAHDSVCSLKTNFAHYYWPSASI